jgi:hypothetical protein
MRKGCGGHKKGGAIPFVIFSLTREVSLTILASIRRDAAVPWAARAQEHADDSGCDVPVLHIPPVRCLTMTAGGTWYGLRRDPTIGFASGVRVLAQVGLLVGILILALQGAPVVASPPDAPSTVVCAATRLPLLMTLGPDSPSILHGMEARPVAVVAGPISPPSDRLALGDDDLDDDDHSSPLAMLTAEAPSLTPAAVVRGVNDSPCACLWPFRYLMRPQLLTRC